MATVDTPQDTDMGASNDVDSEIVEVENFVLRSYQQEMLEQSLLRNVIIAMDTGSGKTHVAISRIQAQLEQSGPDKLVWFTTPSVALSTQQYEVLSANLPAYLIKMLTGDNCVDAWTDQSIWDAVLTNVRVVVGTPQVLTDALTHGFVTISRIALLVFDEAHRCTGNSPMNTIMRDFYYPAKARKESIPNILGLSASPIMSAKSSTLEDVERNLDAVAITPKIHRSELEKHVHPPSITSVIYSEGTATTSPRIVRALESAVATYDISKDPYILDLLTIGDDKAQRDLHGTSKKPTTYCFKQLKALSTRTTAIFDQLGESAAEWYATRCIRRFTEGCNAQSLVLPDVTEKERAHLADILDTLLTESNQVDSPVESPAISDKVHSLVNILSQQSASTRAIVFVEQRAVVAALAGVLRQLDSVQYLSAGTYVGASQFSGRKTSISDLVDLKQQKQDLIDFRDGSKNVMIATTVLEEGIDVSACNLVICFDAPKNLVSYVQRRGRARQRDSKYIVFISNLDPAGTTANWQRLEAEMREAYMKDRQLPELSEVASEAEEELSTRSYCVESTRARLTLQNAKAHLYHFCAVSSNHAGRYVDVRPVLETRNNGGANAWTARITLPSFVHPRVRTAMSSKGYASEGTAVKDAAFEAYTALHKEGLVNDNLLPFANEYVPEVGQAHMDQPSLMQIALRESAWATFSEVSRQCDDNVQWHKHSLPVRDGEKEVIAVRLYLPAVLLHGLEFELYWNREITYTVDIHPVGDVLAISHIETARQYTHAILSSVHEARMSASSDFSYLLSPLDETCNPSDLCGRYPASRLTGASATAHRYILRTSEEPRRSFFYVCTSDFSNDAGENETCINAKPFPRRKNFLHPINPTGNEVAAYTSIHKFALGDCTIDRLPGECAVLAAFVPSIMHRLDLALTAQCLQEGVLQPLQWEDRDLLVEAISAPAANEGFDYNRLEFLGDAILKFYTVRQVMGEHLNWPERYLTLEEHRLVSNATLCKAAERLHLDRFINTKGFNGAKWRPDYLDTTVHDGEAVTREVSSKLLADVVEALIGAAFVDGGQDMAFECLRTLLPAEHWCPHGDPISRMLTEVPTMECAGMATLEKLVGHEFKRPALLLEAITHASFPNNTGLSYERLEFLGDAVLDMIIVPKLFAHSRKMPEWKMHRYHDALVNGKFLSYCCMAYDLEEQSYDAAPATTANGHINLVESVRTIHLYDFLRCGAQVSQCRRKAAELFQQARAVLDDALRTSDEYPWPEIVALEVPKFFSDMVESVLGAIYLDCEGSLDACETFLENLGLMKIMQRMLDEHVEAAYPKEQLGILADKKAIKYETSAVKSDDGKMTFTCTVLVDDVLVASVAGRGSKDEAEARAAREAARVLLERNGNTKGKLKKRRLGSGAGAECVTLVCER